MTARRRSDWQRQFLTAWVALFIGLLAGVHAPDAMAQPEPTNPQPANGELSPADREKLLAGWKAYYAGLYYPLQRTDPERAKDFAARRVGVEWESFRARLSTPPDVVVELHEFATKVLALRAVARVAGENPVAKRLLLDFEFEKLMAVSADVADRIGDASEGFASVEEADAFARMFAADFYDTWGAWLGLLTPEKVRDALMAAAAFTLIPCDTERTAPDEGVRRALQIVETPTWSEFEDAARRVPRYAENSKAAEIFAAQVAVLRQFVVGGETWRAAREGRYDAADLADIFEAATHLRAFAESFRARYPEVWNEWTRRYSRDAAWQFWRHFYIGRIAGLVGIDDVAGRRFAEEYAGMPFDEFAENANGFREMRGDAIAWGEQAELLRRLVIQPATAEAMRAGDYDAALAAADADAKHVFADGARLATFAGEVRQQFPLILQRWIDGITSNELHTVLRAQAAYARWGCTADPYALDTTAGNAAIERLTGMTATAWLNLAASHDEYADARAASEQFGFGASILRRLYFHPTTFRVARSDSMADLWGYEDVRDLFSLPEANFGSADAAAAFDRQFAKDFPDIHARWRSTVSERMYELWWENYFAGLYSAPKGEDERQADVFAALVFGIDRDAFEAMVRADDAHLEAARKAAQKFGLRVRVLRELVMNPATFGAARRGDFETVWQVDECRTIAMRDGAFDSSAATESFSREFGSRFPAVWNVWIGEMTPDLAWAICRVYVAGLFHHSDESEDAEFAREYVRQKIQLDWDALKAAGFRVAPAEAAAIEQKFDLYRRRVLVLRELVCHRETREWALNLDLRAALTHRVGLDVNLKHRAFTSLSDARQIAALFRAEFPDIWFGWRQRFVLDEHSARLALEHYWVGFRSPPSWPGVSAAQGRRILEAHVGVSSRIFNEMLDRQPWGEALREEIHTNFARKLATVKRLLIGEDTGPLARAGRFDDLLGNEVLRRIADPFRSTSEIEEFLRRLKAEFPGVWFSWMHVDAGDAVRGELAWKVYWVYGMQPDATVNIARAQQALMLFSGTSYDEALVDTAISRFRSPIAEVFVPRLRVLRRLLTDFTTREFVRSFDFDKIERGGYLSLNGRAVFIDPQRPGRQADVAREFTRAFREQFPEMWEQWLAGN